MAHYDLDIGRVHDMIANMVVVMAVNETKNVFSCICLFQIRGGGLDKCKLEVCSFNVKCICYSGQEHGAQKGNIPGKRWKKMAQVQVWLPYREGDPS